MIEVLSSIQNRVKDSYAVAPILDLVLRANGEEKTKIIDGLGNCYDANLTGPTVAPTITDDGSGYLTQSMYFGYVYVYASSMFPLIENAVTGGGSVYPRSNPSPITIHQMPGSDQKVVVTVTKTTNTLIDKIWIYRTLPYTTTDEAQNAADAGLMNFISEIDNDGAAGTTTYNDNSLAYEEQIELDNYPAPTIQFVLFADPYFWGFGNYPFIAAVSVSSSGVVTLATAGDKWFDGRDGQRVKLEGIDTGGFDGHGSFYFKWLSATTAQLKTDKELTTDGIPDLHGDTQVKVYGPATTLYRSKSRNPFSWGWTDIVGNLFVPQQYAFKVGGGQGSAIATAPNQSVLKLDTILPSKSYGLNLKLAGTSDFEGSLRLISEGQSVTVHWSQFQAFTQNKQAVLWGFDAHNFAILQSDGSSQYEISNEVFAFLRTVYLPGSGQRYIHGAYDPRLELNCLWITAYETPISVFNYLVFQHVPSGFLGDHA